MAEEISTLVLKVDLNCCKCYTKICKILCKFCNEIKGQVLDDKNNTVTIFGPFDPNKISKKLQCKAGNIIKGIEIKTSKKEPRKPKTEESEKQVAKLPLEMPAVGVCVPVPVPLGFCFVPCYEGYYGRRPCYGADGRPQCYCGCGGDRRNLSRCDYYCEENPTSCTAL